MSKKLFHRNKYRNLTNEAHVKYHEVITNIFEQYNFEQIHDLPQYTAYKTTYAAEVSVLDKMRKSLHTEDIKLQDTTRDDIYHDFALTVEGAKQHYNTALRKPAERVNLVMHNYGKITYKTYDQETAAIDDLLRELRDSVLADIEQLQLHGWLTALENANEQFKNLMHERYKEIAQRPALKMIDARLATDEAFTNLLDILEALMLISTATTTTFAPLVAEINAVTDRYKHLLAQHHHGEKK